jgi:hypothetical protein
MNMIYYLGDLVITFSLFFQKSYVFKLIVNFKMLDFYPLFLK